MLLLSSSTRRISVCSASTLLFNTPISDRQRRCHPRRTRHHDLHRSRWSHLSVVWLFVIVLSSTRNNVAEGQSTANQTMVPSDMTSDHSSTIVPVAPVGSVPTMAPIAGNIPVLPPGQYCWSNLTAVHEIMRYTNPFVPKNIVICPGIYPLCPTQPDLGNCGPNVTSDLQYPLSVRANTNISCDVDGKSSNECILTGGINSILLVDFAFGSYDIETFNNIHISGMIFQDASQITAVLSAQGDIHFHDCIFRDNINWNVVNMIFVPFTTTRRARKLQLRRNLVLDTTTNNSVMMMMDADHNNFRQMEQDDNSVTTTSEDRHLQTIQQMMIVEFVGCLFINNTIYPNPQAETTASPSIIYINGQNSNLTLRNTTFDSNHYQDKDWDFSCAIEQYSVNNIGITIEDVCFLNNEFMTDGVVFVNNISSVSFTNVYADNNSGIDIQCLFIYDNTTQSCTNADATSCSNSEEGSLTSAPAPPTGPSPAVPSPTPPVAPTSMAVAVKDINAYILVTFMITTSIWVLWF